jgi:hypothetical protein
MKPLLVAAVLWIGISGVVFSQQRESLGMNAEVSCFDRLVAIYKDGHEQKLPSNWSQIWNAERLAYVGLSSVGQPLLYRKLAFVDPGPSVDPSGTRILAITHGTTERSWKDKDGNPVLQRGVFTITPQNKVKISFVDADKLFGKIDLNKLALKDPDPSPQQLADTIKVMFGLGYNANQIYAALGNDDIEAVKKSGALDPAFQRMLDEKPPQLASTPTLAASTPQPSATATPAVATEKPSSGFPIVPVVILAAVIAGAAVFMLRRKS